MRNEIVQALLAHVSIEVDAMLEKPPKEELGDYAFPCFALAKEWKKAPNQIAAELVEKLGSIQGVAKIIATGPYVNFFADNANVVNQALELSLDLKKKSGKVLVEFSSPNIAKPFGIGHLRSTVIGNAVANIGEALGIEIIRDNFLGDWGTPHGKIIAGFIDFGSEEELQKDPIMHLYHIYQEVSKNPEYDQKGRDMFNRLEQGDKEVVAYWQRFRDLSLQEFNKMYELLNVKFDMASGEARFVQHTNRVLNELEDKKLLVESEGAWVVELGDQIALIKKSDGATLYLTRDLAAAITRKEELNLDYLVQEIGNEQQLHFKHLYAVLAKMGYEWAKDCVFVGHGLYLDTDGKKFSTRKGKSVLMQDVLDETIGLARQEVVSRYPELNQEETDRRALFIARAAIVFGDLKNYRLHDAVFDIDSFTSFEGDTGPYVLYAYARANSVLEKATGTGEGVEDADASLAKKLLDYPQVVERAWEGKNPAAVAQYVLGLAQAFNEYYSKAQIVGSKNEGTRIALLKKFKETLGAGLHLLGITPLEKM